MKARLRERQREGQRNTKHNSIMKFQFTFESEEKRNNTTEDGIGFRVGTVRKVSLGAFLET